MCEVGNIIDSYYGCWTEDSTFLRNVNGFTSDYTKGVVFKKKVILQALPLRIISQPESFSKQQMYTPTYIIFLYLYLFITLLFEVFVN